MAKQNEPAQSNAAINGARKQSGIKILPRPFALEGQDAEPYPLCFVRRSWLTLDRQLRRKLLKNFTKGPASVWNYLTLEELKWSDQLWEAAGADEVFLYKFCERIHHDLDQLRKLATSGNKRAALELAKIAIIATSDLRKVSNRSPDLLSDLAGLLFAWPVMWSPYQNFCPESPDVGRIGLGGKFPFKFSAKKRFSVDDNAGRLAWRLWHHVNNLRNYALELQTREEVDLRVLSNPAAEIPPGLSEAAELPEFKPRGEVVQQWFKVAKCCLIAACQKRQEPNRLDVNNPLLDGLVRKKHEWSESRLRGKILGALERKFYYFAGLDTN